MRDFILSEIRRLAADNGGVAPGQHAFTRATGISGARWRGVYWVKWSEALAEAGCEPNGWNQKLDSRQILTSVAKLCRHLERFPTRTEIRMQRRKDPSFPSHSTVSNHFPTNEGLTSSLRILANETDEWADLIEYLPAEKPLGHRPLRSASVEGCVYLLKSGKFYKIGRSDDIERRFREVKIALPEAVSLIHTIRSDDPPGIEAYWHRRFATKRANGEWFSLSGDDVRAFCRRMYQ